MGQIETSLHQSKKASEYSGSDSLDERVFAERIHILYGHTPVVLGGGVFVAFVTAAMLWATVSHSLLAQWVGLHLLLALIRGILAKVYFSTRRSGTGMRVRHWAWAYTVGAGISGVLWGSLAWLAMDTASLSDTMIVSLVLFGMIAACIGSHAPFVPSFIAYAYPAGGMLALRFLVEGGSLTLIGILGIVFLLPNTMYAVNLFRTIQESIARRFEREVLLADVQEKREESERANLDKSRFLAAVSHDLRQPLHALDLFHSSLKARLEHEDEQRLLGLASHSSQALGEMLGELMDIARFDTGKVTPEPRIVPLAPLLRDCTDEMRPLADEKGLDMRVRLPRKGCVDTDPVLLKRILRNLLSNAIRHTESGGVLVSTRMRDGWACIEVYDTGPGIAKEQLPYIFDEFYQIDNPERDREKGLGLGLAIVRRVSKMLGHRIAVRSRLGRGSCFSVAVPLCAVAEQCQPGDVEELFDAADVSGLFLVVVDDDRAILQGMRELLRSWGCEVLLAESGAELLAELTTHEYPRPDVLISDYRLRGGHTGLEVVSAVQAHFGVAVPAVIISGDVHPEVQKQVDQTGCCWLQKPVQDDELKRVLAELSQAAA
ncbi:MAG: hypothetical protein COW19_05365 [Zetaproteobacteria bacterium CG12_big_fil_rev_8_21_14_0_65_55_1124]|nr:MAG: hypothetical protein AUJ58_00705 [Zetaproteobacteria bacterium CG1_02_55_237]PIS19662.1 MAG: hypothetical protein COT53_04440 [Zetaproteobacteria bacterium CG08_land_8_20_14_0_20_55_17]PIW42960.1 MAG: hypothetical protein COW19_05365 [Zetaproteobacteria bacterium CG12_big_fil_rev_8_21_14_0_65_55_1124]PIY54263.1 MAG: hypothetical protein COZ01_00900 [Zetaproteobacteria bacterium CG_4_10_14_0_8_um_filter_55_43]PIZ40326.1 MAG: hypothetical protein COY36_00075 [Zetaproteobacteria bacterium 